MLTLDESLLIFVRLSISCFNNETWDYLINLLIWVLRFFSRLSCLLRLHDNLETRSSNLELVVLKELLLTVFIVDYMNVAVGVSIILA